MMAPQFPCSFVFVCKFAEGVEHCPNKEKASRIIGSIIFPRAQDETDWPAVPQVSSSL